MPSDRITALGEHLGRWSNACEEFKPLVGFSVRPLAVEKAVLAECVNDWMGVAPVYDEHLACEFPDAGEDLLANPPFDLDLVAGPVDGCDSLVPGAIRINAVGAVHASQVSLRLGLLFILCGSGWSLPENELAEIG